MPSSAPATWMQLRAPGASGRGSGRLAAFHLTVIVTLSRARSPAATNSMASFGVTCTVSASWACRRRSARASPVG